MDEFPENENENELEESEPQVDFSEKKTVLPKNFLLYSIVLLWFFFLVFIFIYYMSYRTPKDVVQNAHEQFALEQDSTAVLADSTELAATDSVKETNAEVDSSNKGYVPPGGFLTTDDEMRILKLENGRRKREIDYLWDELRTLRKTTKDLEEKTLVKNSASKVKKNTATAVTTNFAQARQEQLTKEKQEEEKRLEEQAEKEKKEKALSATAKLYSNMKPQMAATILTQFDNKEVAFMLKKLRERQAAKILEQMETSKAIQICKLMAK